MKRNRMRLISSAVGFSLSFGLVGCDYWPPALQAEIEQLRSEAHTLTIEKTQLQAQAMDLSRTKQELQGQIDELSRINREKSGMITSLQNQLEAARARALKAMAPKAAPHKKPAMKAKSASKSASKAAAHKSQPPKAVVSDNRLRSL